MTIQPIEIGCCCHCFHCYGSKKIHHLLSNWIALGQRYSNDKNNNRKEKRQLNGFVTTKSAYKVCLWRWRNAEKEKRISYRWIAEWIFYCVSSVWHFRIIIFSIDPFISFLKRREMHIWREKTEELHAALLQQRRWCEGHGEKQMTRKNRDSVECQLMKH